MAVGPIFITPSKEGIYQTAIFTALEFHEFLEAAFDAAVAGSDRVSVAIDFYAVARVIISHAIVHGHVRCAAIWRRRQARSRGATIGCDDRAFSW